jgi:hypothetical protein
MTLKSEGALNSERGGSLDSPQANGKSLPSFDSAVLPLKLKCHNIAAGLITLFRTFSHGLVAWIGASRMLVEEFLLARSKTMIHRTIERDTESGA